MATTQKANPSTVIDEFSKFVAVSRKLQSVPPKTQIKALSSMQAALAKLAKVTPPVQKRSVEIAFNSTRSLAEGLKTNEASKDDVRGFMTEMQAIHAALKDKAAAAIDREARKQRTSTMTRVDVQVADLSDDAQRIFLKYNKFNALVPAQTNKKFVGLRIPIVPISNPPMFMDKLSRYGLAQNSVFGYPILENQNVLGINQTWVERMAEDPEFERDTKKGAPDNIVQALGYAVDFAVSELNERSGRNFTVMGNAFKRGRMFWVWLVPNRDLKKIRDACPGGHLHIERWSFPFQSDVRPGKTRALEDIRRQAREG